MSDCCDHHHDHEIFTPDDDGPVEFDDETKATEYAYRKTLERASLGDPAAQYAIALCILHFGSFPNKEETAIAWLKKAAAAGHVPSQLLLKDM